MPVRPGRLSRLASLGGLAAGVAGRAAGSVVQRGTDAAAERLHRQTAERMAATLGQMKGLPHKVGQILSVLDEGIPARHRAVYGEVLSQLQSQAEPLPWAEVAPVLAADLGVDPSVAFASVDAQPTAAASIGQVHRAVLPDGRAVAVKVQYPGVHEALEADLANVGVLVGTLSAVLPRASVQHLVDDIAATFREELDYEHEAEVQQVVAARWAEDPDIVVPAVVPERCGPRVLTTAWVEGVDFDAACAEPPGRRDRWGSALWRFTWTSVCRDAWLHGDPHPGNLRFLPDGRLAVLDFGATATLPAEMSRGLANASRLAAAGADASGLLGEVLPALGLPRDLAPDVARPWAAFSALVMAPVGPDAPFRFDRAHLREMLEEVQAAKLAMAKNALWQGVPAPQAAGATLLLRTMVGQAAVLARLEASVDGRPLLDALSDASA